MLENIKKIINLSEKRINFLHNINDYWWYEWYKTYIKSIKEEIAETEEEIKENNSVHLEDELWDIFWNFVCLTNSLSEDKLINKEKVFERCYNKFHERLYPDAETEAKNWKIIKDKQKKRLKEEHDEMYWKR